MIPRRTQTPIAFRSDRAAARLKLLTRGGRSQAEVMEEALDLMPVVDAPEGMDPEDAAQLARITTIIQSIPPGSIMSMAEFDALEYDEFGDLR